METLPSKLVMKSSTSASSSEVWMAIQIWHNKPHVVNRRISGAVPIFRRKLNKSLSPVELHKLINSCKIEKSMTDEEIKLMLSKVFAIDDDNSEDDKEEELQKIFTLRKLLPRSDKFLFSLEFTILDEANTKATFFNLQQIPEQHDMVMKLSYSFQFLDGEIQLVAHESQDDTDYSWLRSHVFPKIQKWAEFSVKENIPSLSLVPVDRYISLYQNLKKKYGQSMVEIWPESTDSSKFVYEDVAIATYVLLLWEKQREDKEQPNLKQTFVDLGCGNGLLVHILASEGYKGYGIDVRKRKIWDLYPPTTVLKVQTITPSDDFLFPEVDWIIGNHSDELTPWIPVIAARSSYNCCFFVIPCCSYDFSGCKYQRTSANQSTYSEYLAYVQQICGVCGFESEKDKLRIPSNKRICFIGRKRNHSIDEAMAVEKKITDLLNQRCSRIKRSRQLSESEEGVWGTGFKPREKEEITRNCTKLDKDIVKKVTDIVAGVILRNYKKAEGTSGSWNAGEPVPLAKVAAAIPKELLQEMKNECGGLQTLLKNNHQVFNVENGKVNFRTPMSTRVLSEMVANNPQSKQSKKLKIKVKSCWFFQNHPDGCPLDANDCTYLH